MTDIGDASMSDAKNQPSGADLMGHRARDYGRNAEPLPDIHVFSRLSELDEAYAEELARARARQETLTREIAGLAERLAAPLPQAGGRPDAKPGRAPS